MVSDLKSIGTGYAQGSGYATSSQSVQVGSTSSPQPGQQGPVAPEVTLGSRHSALPRLLDGKSNAADAALAVREAGKALDQVDALLGKMTDSVKLVKNYPPFPAGNEDRMHYLNSIDGLRKELQAMIIPPVADQYQPVFYPQRSEFPELDAKVPSDAAVLAFGKAIEIIKGEVKTARVVLQGQASQLSMGTGSDIPSSPEESQVPALSAAVAAQLGSTFRPISGNSEVLAQLGS